MTGIVMEMTPDQRRRSFGGGMTAGRVLPFARRLRVGAFIFSHHTGLPDLAATVLSVEATAGISEGSQP